MEDITRLFKHVQDTFGKLTRLSDNRLQRLEKCLQLKQFDEECSKVCNSDIEKLVRMSRVANRFSTHYSDFQDIM